MIRLGILTDLHWAVDPPAGETWNNPYDFEGLAARVEEAVAALAGVDALVVLGDLCHWGDEESLRDALDAVVGAAGVPVWAIPGNHDRAQDPQFFEAVAGERALNAAPWPIDPGGGDGRLVGCGASSGVRWKEGRVGRLPALPAAAPLVVASHYPLISAEALLKNAGFRYSEDALDREAALTRLPPMPTVVLSGHVHARVSQAEGSVLQLLQPALIEPPYECALIEIDATVVRRRCIAVGTSDAERVPVFCDADETWAYDGEGWQLGGRSVSAD